MVVVPTIAALADRGALEALSGAGDGIPLDAVALAAGADRAGLRVALRLLAAQGWLLEDAGADRGNPAWRVTTAGRLAFEIAPAACRRAAAFLGTAANLPQAFASEPDAASTDALREIVDWARCGWGLCDSGDETGAAVVKHVRRHLDGVVVGPAMVTLARSGVLDLLAARARPLHVDDLLGCLIDALSLPGWVSGDGSEAALTEEGACAASIAPAYGVVVSYLSFLGTLPHVLAGSARRRRAVIAAVDTATNQWGCDGAHRSYVAQVDPLIVDLFNRPLAEQPVGICEVGCGSGVFLQHLYTVVRDRTARGRILDTHPLVVVGVDSSKDAREATLRMLRRESIPECHILAGSITRPAEIAQQLERWCLQMHDLLHVRAFADHARTDGRPADLAGASADVPADSGGWSGNPQASLVRHFRLWKPFIERFGLVAIEAHSLPSCRAGERPGRTPAAAYEALFGYASQNLVELSLFLDCARRAGLDRDARFQAQFPSSGLGTVSLSFFTVPNTMKA